MENDYHFCENKKQKGNINKKVNLTMRSETMIAVAIKNCRGKVAFFVDYMTLLGKVGLVLAKLAGQK